MSGDGGSAVRRGRVAARGAFVAYALLIACLTHWPRLSVDLGDVPRPDLWIHLGVFSVWQAMLVWASFFGPALSPRNLLWSGAIGAGYAAVSEATQRFVPGRFTSPEDLAANLFGVAAGLSAVMLLGVLEPERAGGRA